MSAALAAAAVGAGAAIYSASSQPSTSGINNAAASLDQTQAGIAQNEWNNFSTNFMPLEDSFAGQAQQWTSPQNYDKAAASAASTVDSQFANAKSQLERTPGMDPSSGAYQAGMTNIGLQQAASSAATQNNARTTTENQGIGMEEAAMNVGNGLSASANQAGSSAGNNLTGLSNLVNGQNTQSANSIGSAAQGVANGVTSFMNNGSGSGSYNFTTGISSSDPSYGVSAGGLSGVGYTMPASTGVSFLSNS